MPKKIPGDSLQGSPRGTRANARKASDIPTNNPFRQEMIKAQELRAPNKPGPPGIEGGSGQNLPGGGDINSIDKAKNPEGHSDGPGGIVDGKNRPLGTSDIKRGNGISPQKRKGSPFDAQEGFGEPKKKTFSKVARETTGKFVKILGFAFVGHHLGLFDITDPLNRESEEEKCIRECEEKNTDTGGEKLKECIDTNCKDEAGNLIGGIVNVIIVIVVFIIIFNIGKKILKKKGKVGESSNNQYDDYDYDDYDYN